MIVKVRMPAGAIGDIVVALDSPLCKLRGLAKEGNADIEAVLVSPEKDIPRIAAWIGQPSEPVIVKIGDQTCPIKIGMIRDMVIAP